MNSSSEILKQVVADTEKIFTKIAEDFPKMLKELEHNTTDASLALERLALIKPKGAETSEAIPVGTYFKNKIDESKHALTELNEFKKQNELIINKLTTAITDYQDSQAYIEEIRDISESLQIVSLNALVNAVKAGKGGEGFSVITGNLKNITGTTIEKTGSLEIKGDSVMKHLEVFRSSETAISETRHELVDILEHKMVGGIDTFRVESAAVNNLLSGLGSESQKVRKAVLRIMEELQQQDIIRQTIDQILMSMEKLPAGYEEFSLSGESGEHEMDEAVFCERLLDISVIMLDEVVEKLEKTAEVFSGNFVIARDKLEFIQNEKKSAIDQFLKNLDSVSSLSEMNVEVRDHSRELSMKREDLITLISGLLHQVEEISDEIESFEKISGLLQNIAVLSRIELTRSSSLSHMKESIDDMAELVERIQEQIRRGQKETGDFISATGVIFGEYENYAAEENKYMDLFSAAFLNGIQEISNINTAFSDTLGSFVFFSDEFRSMFEISAGEIEQLRKIIVELAGVSESLRGVKDRFSRIIKETLNEKKILEWNISDEHLNKIIERFTIYSHKKSAGELTGLEVEESALDAGEVTLF